MSPTSSTAYESLRLEFSLIKQSKEFATWRRNQREAQRGRCFYEPLKGKVKWARQCKGALLGHGAYHIDHIAPLWYGGSNDYKNLVLACSNCNYGKKARPITKKDLYICLDAIGGIDYKKTIRTTQQSKPKKRPKTTGYAWLELSLIAFNGSGYADRRTNETFVESYIAYKKWRNKPEAVLLASEFYASALVVGEYLVTKCDEPAKKPDSKGLQQFTRLYNYA